MSGGATEKVFGSDLPYSLLYVCNLLILAHRILLIGQNISLNETGIWVPSNRHSMYQKNVVYVRQYNAR